MITWETLQDHGIAVARFERVTTLAGAETFIGKLDGGTACLKAETNLHKAALGLVELGVGGSTPLGQAWERLATNAARAELAPPFLMQEEIPAGPELFVGVMRDPTFGHVLAAGIGGRLIELIRVRALRFLPIGLDEAHGMVAELGLGHLSRPAALDAFAALLAATSHLLAEHPEIDELDLNPVILGEDRAVAVDLRVLSSAAQPPATTTTRGDSRAAIAQLVSPRSVAIIGASGEAAKPGGRAYRYLAEFAPEVRRYPVNRRGGTLDGMAVATRISDLPRDIDAAVIATPAASVAQAIRDLGTVGVPAVVVFASGFREAGRDDLEREVATAARSAGVRVCGVNGMGLIGDAPLTFTQALNRPAISGGVSFLTQSGAIGGSLLIGAWARELGTARFVSVGNETDLAVPDYLEFLAGDDATTTIGLFLEGVADGRRLRSALHAVVSAGKGIAVLRTGVGQAAATAVSSHTGALAGSDDAYREVFRETGVAVASDVHELLGLCQALEWQPRAAGRRVGVLSTSGGGCSLVADMLEGCGLEVPELEPAAQARLAAVLPNYAPTRNPVDTTGNITSDPSLLENILSPVLESDRIDAVVVAISALVGDTAQAIVASIVDVAASTTKPIIVGWMLPESVVAPQFRVLREARIPVFDSIALACRAVAALAPPARAAEGSSSG